MPRPRKNPVGRPRKVAATAAKVDSSHYQTKSMECIEVIRAALTPEEFRGYCKGNAIKYLYREQDKQGELSLKKGRDYMSMLIDGKWSEQ